jgi:hypothetical protein
MAIAGLGWLTFLSPTLAGQWSSYILAPRLIGDSLCLWLLVMGVNVANWNEKARVAVGVG